MITIRASALSDFLDCPARAEARHLLGKRTPSNGAAQLGTAIHASTAAYDASALAGAGVTVDEAFAAAVDAIHRPETEVQWDDDYPPSDAERTARALHHRYCTEVAPQQDYAAVEVTCERLEIADLGIALTGTTDRVRRVDDGFAIADIKTGKTAVAADGRVETKGHTFQLGVYELLAQQASGLPITGPALIIGMQTGKTDRAQRIGIGRIEGARDVLLGDSDSPGILEMVARMIGSGLFPGNPRSMTCGEKFCPIFQTCKFRR